MLHSKTGAVAPARLPRRAALPLPASIAGPIAIALTNPLSDVVIGGGASEQIASDTCIFGYPLVSTGLTLRVLANVAGPEGTPMPGFCIEPDNPGPGTAGEPTVGTFGRLRSHDEGHWPKGPSAFSATVPGDVFRSPAAL